VASGQKGVAIRKRPVAGGQKGVAEGSGQWSEGEEEFMAVRHYAELIAWQKGMELVQRVYKATEGFASKEKFGLTNQVRRAVVSIPSNIAEGQGRNSTRDFIHFLAVAMGSLQEAETQLMIAE
jgi:hypothetical protein